MEYVYSLISLFEANRRLIFPDMDPNRVSVVKKGVLGMACK